MDRARFDPECRDETVDQLLESAGSTGAESRASLFIATSTIETLGGW